MSDSKKPQEAEPASPDEGSTAAADTPPATTSDAKVAQEVSAKVEDQEVAAKVEVTTPVQAPAVKVDPSTLEKVKLGGPSEEAAPFTLGRRLAHVLQTLSYTHQWIVLADTKGGLLLTANSVVVGFMIAQFSKLIKVWPTTNLWYFYLLLLLFGGYALYQAYSFLHTMWIILPRPMGMSKEHLRKTRHVFNYSLTLNFPTLADGEKLKEEYLGLSEEELFEEYVLQLHIDSIVCTQKYTAFMKAFRAMQMALVIGGLAFIGSIPLTHKSAPKAKPAAQVLKKDAKRVAPPLSTPAKVAPAPR